MPERIAAAWEPGLIERHGVVRSTMEIAAERAQQGAPEGTTIVAEAQTQGRGRRGRQWFSPARAGLWLTVILRPEARQDLHTLSLVTGLATLRALHAAGAEHLRLKWPNDIVVVHNESLAKVAGILAQAESSVKTTVLMGLGVNLEPASELDMPTNESFPYAGLRQWLPEVSAEALMTAILQQLAGDYARWQADGFAAHRSEWQRWDVLFGRQLVTEGAEDVAGLEGVGSGIDDTGCLLLETSEGTVPLAAGLVTLKRAYGV